MSTVYHLIKHVSTGNVLEMPLLPKPNCAVISQHINHTNPGPPNQLWEFRPYPSSSYYGLWNVAATNPPLVASVASDSKDVGGHALLVGAESPQQQMDYAQCFSLLYSAEHQAYRLISVATSTCIVPQVQSVEGGDPCELVQINMNDPDQLWTIDPPIEDSDPEARFHTFMATVKIDSANLQEFYTSLTSKLKAIDIPIVYTWSDLSLYEQKLERRNTKERRNSPPLKIETHWWGIDFIFNEDMTQDLINFGGLSSVIGGAAPVGLLAVITPALTAATIPGINLIVGAVAAVLAIAFASQAFKIAIADSFNHTGVHFPMSWPQWAALVAAAPTGAGLPAMAALVVTPWANDAINNDTQTLYPLGNANGTWQLLPNQDLAFIQTNSTPNNLVEVHILSRKSNYQKFEVQLPTAFPIGDDQHGSWHLFPNQDLGFIKTSNTPNNLVEVHILSRKSNYQKFEVQYPTAFPIGDDQHGTWHLFPNEDLGFIKTSNTPTNYVEVHILSRRSNYKKFEVQLPTGFNNADDPNGTWHLLPNQDLGFIKTSNTPNNQVEVHIRSRKSKYHDQMHLPTSFTN